MCLHTDTDRHAQTHTPKNESCSIAITAWLCRNLVSNDWWDLLRAKEELWLLCLCVHVLFMCSVSLCASVRQQSLVSLWMCMSSPPSLYSPLSLTSIAISEAAVEAALFWQMLTLSKCISEDVMALVTLSLPLLYPPLSISSLLFFTLPPTSLPWSNYGFKHKTFASFLAQGWIQWRFTHTCIHNALLKLNNRILWCVHRAQNIRSWRPKCRLVWTVVFFMGEASGPGYTVIWRHHLESWQFPLIY